MIFNTQFLELVKVVNITHICGRSLGDYCEISENCENWENNGNGVRCYLESGLSTRGDNSENDENSENGIRCWLESGLGTEVKIVKIVKIVIMVYGCAGWKLSCIPQVMKMVKIVFTCGWCHGDPSENCENGLICGW